MVSLPLALASGVYSMILLPVLIAAVPMDGAVVIADTVRSSPSTSVSLVITLTSTLAESSSIVTASLVATGASLTAVMLTVTVAALLSWVPSDTL